MIRIILTATWILCSITSIGQSSESARKAFYGFNLGLNHSNIQVKTNSFPVGVQNKTGFNLGLIGGYQLSKSFSLIANSSISFHDNEINVFDYSSYFYGSTILPTTLDFGLQANYQFLTKLKTSPYLLIGPSIQIPISQPVLTTEFGSRSNLAIEFGLGVNIKFSEFVFAPEMRYSYGISNVNTNPSLTNVNFHSIKLLFNFKSF